MNHIDEHTLELYALKAKEVAGKVDEIEKHLTECYGCRALVEEMQGYYIDLDEELKKEPKSEFSEEKALVRQKTHLKPYYESFAPQMPYRPNTPLAKVFYFVQRHPVTVTMSSFAVVGLLGWFLNDAIRSFSSDKKITDTNPVYYYLNNSTGYLEIKNKENQKLWEMASYNIEEIIKRDEKNNIKTTFITDINNDGKNEILTTLPLTRGEGERNHLTIFSSEQKIIQEISLGRSILYNGRQYLNSFSTGGLIVDDFNSGSKQIIVCARNYRSPTVISRLDSKGKILGEYWHFGHIIGIYTIDVTGDGKNEILLCGMNDVSDTNHQEFPAIIVLNPERITGELESQCTPGFGLKKSDAEIFYIHIPRTDIDDALYLTPAMQGVLATDNGQLRFTTSALMVDKKDFQFDYIFSHDLKPLQVKSNNQTDQIHYHLAQQGKLGGKIDQAYLDNLKNGIRYWDGKEWRKEWTGVQFKRQN